MDATADTVIQAGDVVAVAGRREVLVKSDRRRRRRSRRSRTAGGAGRRRRCLCDQQGRRRKNAGRAGEPAGRARRVPAQDHPRRDRNRHPDSAGHAVAAGRHRHPRRPHPGRRGRDQDVGLSGPRDRRGGRGVHRCGDRDRRACSARWSTRSAACRSRCPPPAAR